jgi:ribonuclease HII
MMREMDSQYPLYGLASNKGYSTPKHKAILREHGPSPLHRQSFAPVWMAQAEHAPDLFAEFEREMEADDQVQIETECAQLDAIASS